MCHSATARPTHEVVVGRLARVVHRPHQSARQALSRMSRPIARQTTVVRRARPCRPPSARVARQVPVESVPSRPVTTRVAQIRAPSPCAKLFRPCHRFRQNRPPSPPSPCQSRPPTLRQSPCQGSPAVPARVARRLVILPGSCRLPRPAPSPPGSSAIPARCSCQGLAVPARVVRRLPARVRQLRAGTRQGLFFASELSAVARRSRQSRPSPADPARVQPVPPGSPAVLARVARLRQSRPPSPRQSRPPSSLESSAKLFSESPPESSTKSPPWSPHQSRPPSPRQRRPPSPPESPAIPAKVARQALCSTSRPRQISRAFTIVPHG